MAMLGADTRQLGSEAARSWSKVEVWARRIGPDGRARARRGQAAKRGPDIFFFGKEGRGRPEGPLGSLDSGGGGMRGGGGGSRKKESILALISSIWARSYWYMYVGIPMYKFRIIEQFLN